MTKSTMMNASNKRLYEVPIRVSNVYARRCAIPDLFAIAPIRMAPNRNHGVSLEKPEKARSNSATPRAQKRKTPMKPATA